ncbi:MAG: apolipoprotein N-acyltransferase [Candidatus Omnitrophica bacterium]|nr:apolipoprotein N-acyltransferase [Candidatus Omnitrophota bacterium]MBU1922896.1 apolipoprotein N-acyltransferase [Candidatus Omnitrophota bacterium]
MSQVILPILTASLLSLSFSSFNLWLFAWFGFIPLFISLEKRSLLQSFIVGYLCGIVFWSLTIYWLIHVTLLGQAVLILYLAVYFGLLGCAVYLFRFLSPGVFLFFIPCAWVLLEYLRSYLFTGFPWALIGFSQYKNLPVIQIAEITGSWGVSFLVVLVNVVFYLALRKRLKLRIILIFICILYLSLAYGFYRLSYKPDLRCDKELLKVSVVQGNIPQDLKWDKQAAAGILNNYIELTSAAAKDNPSLIIWPEASVPVLWGGDSADVQFAQVFSLARQLKISLLVGAVSCSDEVYFNSALFINNLGQPERVYNKLHLVPFGEYVPFKKIFPFLQSIAPIGDIEPGKEYTIFSQRVNFSVLICFEDLFPELSREFVKRGARFLVNITNDAWYKQSSAPYQHFAASVFRAVENRVYLVRAANTGISGFIDPFGRPSSIVQDVAGKDSFIKGYSSKSICLTPIRHTIYNRYGDLLIIFCLLFDTCVIIFVLRKRK